MIPLFKVFTSTETSEKLRSTFNSGFLAEGVQVEEFENLIKKKFNTQYITAVNSATSGLTLALRLLNLTSKDEIITSPLTCMASTVSILTTPAKIVWTDVDNGCHMDLDDLGSKINKNTKAILLVHWAGVPIDLYKLQQIKENAEQEFNTSIMVIEDCAHAFGSKYDGRYIGSFNQNICVFSFQAIKHLTTGDGGCVILPNEELYERSKLLKWYGIDRNYKNNKDFRIEHDISEWGYKFNMNNISATIGVANFPYIEDNISHARYIATLYDNELQNIPNLSLASRPALSNSCFWLYTIFIKNRLDFIKWMHNCNIMVSQVHQRNDVHSCVAQYKSNLPNLDKLSEEICCIPIGWWVTQENAYYIVNCVKQFCYALNSGLGRIRKLELMDKYDYCSLIQILINIPVSLDDTEFLKYYNRLNDDNIVVVMTDDNKVIGTAKMFIEYKLLQPVAHIEDVIVKSDYRRQGFGNQLIEYLSNIAFRRNCYKIILESNELNVKFYEKCDFVKEGFEMVKRLKI